MTNAEKHAAMMNAELVIAGAYEVKKQLAKELLPSEPFFAVYATPMGWSGMCQSYSWLSGRATIEEGPEMALSRIKDAVHQHINEKKGA